MFVAQRRFRDNKTKENARSKKRDRFFPSVVLVHVNARKKKHEKKKFQHLPRFFKQVRVRSRSHHIVGVGVERRRRRSRRRSIRFSSLFLLHIFSLFFCGQRVRFFFFFVSSVHQTTLSKVPKFLSQVSFWVAHFFQIKCVCSFCRGFKTKKRMSSSPPKTDGDENDGDKWKSVVFFLGQSYAPLRVDGKGCDDDDDFWGKILKEEGRWLAVSVECSPRFGSAAHREGSCLYHVRIESSHGHGRWCRPMPNVLWVEMTFSMEDVLRHIEEIGFSGVDEEDVREMIREGLRKKERKVNAVVERRGGVSLQGLSNDQALDALHGKINMYCEIECVMRGHSKPFTLTLPPTPTNWNHSDIALVNENIENRGGSVGMSKFAYRAMKELEELREAVRNTSNNEDVRKKEEISQKYLKEYSKELPPPEAKAKSPVKRKAMGGGFGGNVKIKK